MTARKHYTSNDIEIIAQMTVAGKSAAEIAPLVGRTAKAITNQLSDAEIRKTPTGRLISDRMAVIRNPKGSTMKPINAINYRWPFLTGANAVIQPAPVVKPKHHRERWTDAANNQLIRGFASGKTVTELAIDCGRTEASVAGQLRALDMLTLIKTDDALYYVTKVWHKVSLL